MTGEALVSSVPDGRLERLINQLRGFTVKGCTSPPKHDEAKVGNEVVDLVSDSENERGAPPPKPLTPHQRLAVFLKREMEKRAKNKAANGDQKPVNNKLDIDPSSPRTTVSSKESMAEANSYALPPAVA